MGVGYEILTLLKPLDEDKKKITGLNKIYSYSATETRTTSVQKKRQSFTNLFSNLRKSLSEASMIWSLVSDWKGLVTKY